MKATIYRRSEVDGISCTVKSVWPAIADGLKSLRRSLSQSLGRALLPLLIADCSLLWFAQLCELRSLAITAGVIAAALLASISLTHVNP